MNTRCASNFFAILGLCALVSGTAGAATVYINTPSLIGTPTTAVASAKFRASPTNWDMSLSNGGGTSAGTFIQANLNNSFNPPGRTYNFTLENRPGQGLIFRAVQGNSAPVTLAWGDFSPAVTGNVVSTIAGAPPPAAFNLLTLTAQADRPAASTTWSNLVFNSPTLDLGGGAFTSGTATSSTGTVAQTLVGDTSIAAHSWTLSGTITLLRPGGGGAGDENVRFVVTMSTAPFLAPVPEPGSALLALAAAGAFMQRRRRNQ
jgi:hypothetical protein